MASKKPKKDHRPGIRVPTAKGSRRHKSEKDYSRRGNKVDNKLEYCFHEPGTRMNVIHEGDQHVFVYCNHCGELIYRWRGWD